MSKNMKSIKGKFWPIFENFKVNKVEKGKRGTKFPFFILKIHLILPSLKLHGEILPNSAILFMTPGKPWWMYRIQLCIHIWFMDCHHVIEKIFAKVYSESWKQFFAPPVKFENGEFSFYFFNGWIGPLINCISKKTLVSGDVLKPRRRI